MGAVQAREKRQSASKLASVDVPRYHSVPSNDVGFRNFIEQCVCVTKRVHSGVKFDEGGGDMNVGEITGT